MVPPIDGIREVIRIGPEKVIIRQVSIIFGTDGTNDQIGRHTPLLTRVIHANQAESTGIPFLQGNYPNMIVETVFRDTFLRPDKTARVPDPDDSFVKEWSGKVIRTTKESTP